MSDTNDSLYRANAATFIIDPITHHILLVKALHYDVSPWDAPKGGVEDGETWQATALREIYEEVGTIVNAIVMDSEVIIIYDWPESLQKKTR